MSPEEKRAKRAAYQREWRAKNREKDRASKRKYYEANVEKVRASRKRYFENNKEKCYEATKKWGKANIEKRRSYVRNYQARNPHKTREINLRLSYGITPADYERLLSEQGGICAICPNTNGDKRLGVDHCHTTGIVRGLLCDNCNRGIGLFKDDQSRLQSAIDYLRKPR